MSVDVMCRSNRLRAAEWCDRCVRSGSRNIRERSVIHIQGGRLKVGVKVEDCFNSSSKAQWKLENATGPDSRK